MFNFPWVNIRLYSRSVLEGLELRSSGLTDPLKTCPSRAPEGWKNTLRKKLKDRKIL